MVVTSDIIAIGVLIGLVSIEILPEKPQRILWGILLFILGLLPVLFMVNIINFNILSFGLMGFVTMFIAIVCGELLFTEGLLEENIVLKILSIVIGLTIILVTSIPWLGDFNAISFQVPSYSPLINLGIYLASGVLVMIGAFKAKD